MKKKKLQTLPRLFIASLFLVSLTTQAKSEAETKEAALRGRVEINCSKNLHTSFNNLDTESKKYFKQNDKFYKKNFSSIEEKFQEGNFNGYDMQIVYDKLKSDIKKIDHTIKEPTLTAFKTKLDSCKNSLVAYYKNEYLKTCIEKGEKTKTKKNKLNKQCKEEGDSKERWFNEM